MEIKKILIKSHIQYSSIRQTGDDASMMFTPAGENALEVSQSTLGDKAPWERNGPGNRWTELEQIYQINYWTL